MGTKIEIYATDGYHEITAATDEEARFYEDLPFNSENVHVVIATTNTED